MTSKLTFLNIKSRTTLDPSDIAPSERKEGRLKAGSALNCLQDDTSLRIDVLILKKSTSVICDDMVEFYEDDIRDRKTLDYEEIIRKSSFQKKRLAIGTSFLKNIKSTDVIEIIVH